MIFDSNVDRGIPQFGGCAAWPRDSSLALGQRRFDHVFLLILERIRESNRPPSRPIAVERVQPMLAHQPRDAVLAARLSGLA